MLKLFLDRVVFDEEVVFNEFLENLLESELIDLCVALEPADLHPYRFENTLPVNHMVEFIFKVAILLEFLALDLRFNALHVWHEESLELAASRSHVVILEILACFVHLASDLVCVSAPCTTHWRLLRVRNLTFT